ncbi:MAG: glutamate synthase subunit beta [Candidatus Omnitrophica bacterium]|nr:glutamate synthase subunit beta [Candidatus Omnitrophota bacterium]
MAKDNKGFLKIKRKKGKYRPVEERVGDFCDVTVSRSDDDSVEQATRCMDCGTTFCHWACPVGNYIPEWNELLAKGDWDKAYELLSATNNLPEITGRVCPALCESACVLGINDEAVTIRENELAIAEHAFKTGKVKGKKVEKRTGKKVAVIGSGPAGLAAADELNKKGHHVTVFEKDRKIGGFLRYGIPDFKLEKWVLDRRVDLLKKEGVDFKTDVKVGEGFKTGDLVNDFDAVCLAGGSRFPRDLAIEGRDSEGIVFAVDYLSEANKKVSGEKTAQPKALDARGKHVIVIGGGDTGADCIGTANRQGARSIVQLEVLPEPPECRTEDYPWPKHPLVLKTTSSHEEGAARKWAVSTKKFISETGQVKKLECVQVEFSAPEGACPVMREIEGTEFTLDADLVILAIGFLSPEHKGLLDELALEYDKRGNVKTDQSHKTSRKKIFACGDMHRGQSLVVWAIHEGREAAKNIDEYLTSSR